MSEDRGARRKSSIRRLPRSERKLKLCVFSLKFTRWKRSSLLFFFFRVRELFEKPPSKPMRTKMEEQKKWIKTYVFFNICQKSNWIQKLRVLSFQCVPKCLYGKSRVNMGIPQKYMLWFYLILGSSHIALWFLGGIMMYDKECEAVMKIKFELRMKLNHNR